MWRIILLLALCSSLPFRSFCEQIKVTTWNLEWFPSGSPNLASLEVETKRIQDAADVLRGINPDVILLQEIRDLETCEKLARALKPEIYTVAVCSPFKDGFGNAIGWQQVAILSKKPALAAWSEAWKSVGKVDPPRGFSFAAIRYGTNDMGFYSVHLKSNLTSGNAELGNQLNILKRELAAEQILRHSKEVEAVLTNQLEVVVVGGDFNTNPDQDLFVSEKTLRLFNEEKFFSGFENVSLVNRVTHPGKGRYPDATFDYLYVRGVSNTKPQILSSPVSDHYPVTTLLNVR
jgi:endonuclease/exonuclease/phosphatase family metal-dependent hydrolase